MSWFRALVWAIVIFVYFAFFTAWLPSFFIEEVVEGWSAIWRDIFTAGIWTIAFGVGIWGLRSAQRRGWI